MSHRNPALLVIDDPISIGSFSRACSASCCVTSWRAMCSMFASSQSNLISSATGAFPQGHSLTGRSRSGRSVSRCDRPIHLAACPKLALLTPVLMTPDRWRLRTFKHARYSWPLLVESHLTRQQVGAKYAENRPRAAASPSRSQSQLPKPFYI